MRLIGLIAALVFAVSGCAGPSYAQLGTDALKRGEHAKARQLLERAIREGEVEAFNNLGVTYARSGMPNEALQAYRFGARYGDATAQENLRRLGQPVPEPDLARKRAAAQAANDEATAILLEGLVPVSESIGRALGGAFRK